MKTLIIDDERLAREELRSLLQPFPQIEIIGEAVDADDAKAKIEALRPELIFLDVQMPGKTGFELLESLQFVPKVIFYTAYDEYAIRAFEVSALDYLLKPIDPVRLAHAIAKLAHNAEEPVKKEAVLPGSLRGKEKVFVREGDRCWFVEIRAIRLLKSEGNYTRLLFDAEQPAIPGSLNGMEARLDPEMFFRANRSELINLKWINRIEPRSGGGLIVTLTGGEQVEVSRRQAQEFNARMGL